MIILIILIIIIIFIITINKYFRYKRCSKNTFFQHKTNVDKIFSQQLLSNGYTKTSDIYNAKIILPKYKLSNKIMDNIYYSKECKHYINYILNSFHLGKKDSLWKLLVSEYGRENTRDIMPTTYIFPKDKVLFHQEYLSNKYYILKNNKQRQEGLMITNNYDDIINHKNMNYILIQELLTNCAKYKGHKFNLRIYMFMIGDKCYVYNDGIVSYAKVRMDGDKYDFDNSVCSFYTSKRLYDKGFPIIISQFGRDILWTKIYEIIGMIYDAFRKKMVKNYGLNMMHLFGVDFLMTDDGRLYLLEINLSPGMKPYNEIDKKMRYNLFSDIICLIEGKYIDRFRLIN